MHSTVGMHGRDKDPRWVPPIITKVFGVRIVNNAMEWWSEKKEISNCKIGTQVSCYTHPVLHLRESSRIDGGWSG